MKTIKFSKEEEIQLVTDYQTNDCLKSRDKLIMSQMGMIVNKSRKMTPNESKQEEYQQEAVIALLKGLATFDLSRGYRLSTYAGYVITNAIYAYNRPKLDIMSDYRLMADSTTQLDNNGDYVDLVDTMPHGDGDLLDTIIRDDVVTKVDVFLNTQITSFKRECFMSSNMACANNRDTAKIFGTSHQNISFHAQGVREKLMRHICKGI